MLGAPVFGWSIAVFGVRPTLAGLGAVVLVACAIAAALLRAARIDMHDPSAPQAESDRDGGRLGRTFVLLAAVFFLAASAGLTVLSQAAAIVQAYGGAAAFAVGATTFITGAVGAARIGGGWLVDHFAAARVGVGAHACSLAGAMLLMLNPTPLSAALRLGLIGVGYGIVSGLAAGAIAQYWHKNQFGHIAGPPLHRLVRGSRRPAGARGGAVRSHGQLCVHGVGGGGDQCGGDARRRQAAGAGCDLSPLTSVPSG
jgi:hypothetical protein